MYLLVPIYSFNLLDIIFLSKFPNLKALVAYQWVRSKSCKNVFAIRFHLFGVKIISLQILYFQEIQVLLEFTGFKCITLITVKSRLQL